LGRRSSALSGWRYEQVAFLTAVEAKNEAVRLAYQARCDLVLVEDDVIVPWADWPTEDDAIYAADAICRGGTLNTVRDSLGDVLYTGTCFVRVPWWAMDRMGAGTERLFEPALFHPDGDQLRYAGPDPHGQHSDVFFFWRARRCGIPVRIFGRASHLLHAASGPADNVTKVMVV
jgi:hypothetical protein